jgi:hypothetical protein
VVRSSVGGMRTTGKTRSVSLFTTYPLRTPLGSNIVLLCDSSKYATIIRKWQVLSGRRFLLV